MKEVKIQIPDNCELIKDGDTYIVTEKKQGPPRSWEEFCKKYPVESREAFIDSSSHIQIRVIDSDRYENTGRNWCYSKEEAEAFLALIQLRQLRKAWIGDWEPKLGKHFAVISDTDKGLDVIGSFDIVRSMSFPDRPMAEDFFDCFRDLCEKARKLL